MSACVSPEGKSLSSHRHGTNLKKMTLKNSALLRYISLTAGRALRALKDGLSGVGGLQCSPPWELEGVNTTKGREKVTH